MASSVFLMAPGLSILFPDGTAGAPSIAFASEPTLGFSRPSAGIIQANGAFQSTGNLSASTNLISGSTNFLIFGARSTIGAPGDGTFNLATSATTTGVGLDVATDAILKIRTRAQTGYATLDCLGLKASGAAGASGTGTVVSQLTVVNGIVTSCTIA